MEVRARRKATAVLTLLTESRLTERSNRAEHARMFDTTLQHSRRSVCHVVRRRVLLRRGICQQFRKHPCSASRLPSRRAPQGLGQHLIYPRLLVLPSSHSLMLNETSTWLPWALRTLTTSDCGVDVLLEHPDLPVQFKQSGERRPRPVSMQTLHGGRDREAPIESWLQRSKSHADLSVQWQLEGKRLM